MEARLGIIEVATVAEGVKIGYMVFVCANIITVTVGYRGYISPLVVGVTSNEIAGLIGYSYYIILRVADVVITVVKIIDRTDTSVCIGIEVDISDEKQSKNNPPTVSSLKGNFVTTRS